MRHKITINLLLQLLMAGVVYGQVGIVDQNADKKPAIVFIGTYHMGNEGSNNKSYKY